MLMQEWRAALDSDTYRGPDSLWTVVEDDNAVWRQAIRHALGGNVDALESLLKSGIDIHKVFTLTMQKAVEQDVPLSAIRRPMSEHIPDLECEPKEEIAITLLHAAAKRNQVAVIEVLLLYGAEVDVICRPTLTEDPWQPVTPLFEAAIRGHFEAAKCLLDAGAAPGGVGYKRVDMLSACLEGYHRDRLKPPHDQDIRDRLLILLLERGADPEMKGYDAFCRPMEIAVLYNRPRVVYELHRRGASCAKTLEFFAAGGGSEQLLEFLLEHGAQDVHDAVIGCGYNDSFTDENIRALNLVLDRFPEYLTSGIARVDMCDLAQRGETTVMKLLHDRGMNIDAAGKGGLPPIFHCASSVYLKGHKAATMQWFIDSGAELHKRLGSAPNFANHDYGGKTLLHFAMQRWHEHLIKLLLDAGLDVNAKSLEGETPLMELCRDGAVRAWDSGVKVDEMIDNMLCAGMELNDIQSQGMTALHLLAADRYSCTTERAELAQVLIERGASPYVRDHQGDLPFSYAIRCAEQHENFTLSCVLNQHTSDYQLVIKAMSGDAWEHSKEVA